MKEHEKEFYANIGMLSVQYSRMEYNLSVIVSELFGVEDKLVSTTVTEKNSLTQNIDLLVKLNRINDFKYEEISDMILGIRKIQDDRNLFVHGIWKEPVQTVQGIEIVCEERKIKYSEERGKDGKLMNRSWSMNRHYVFTLAKIKKQIEAIEKIIANQTVLIRLLEERES